MEDTDELETEQAAMDEHNKRVTDLLDCLAWLATPKERGLKVKIDPQQHLRRRLQHVEQNL